MKILVTGGAGYIGSILVPEILRAGHEVKVLDNFMYGQMSLLDQCFYKTLDVVRGDARNEELMKDLMKDVEFIFPLAAIVGMSACDKEPLLAKTTNLEAIKLILKLRRPGQKIIFPNTNSGYGVGKQDAYCDERAPLNPISLYGRTKVEAEKEVLQAGDAITFRVATVFGMSPRMRFDLLVNDFVYKALTDKSIVLFESHFKRNYIHVRDVARAFIHAMDNFETMKNEPYNVGLSSANMTKKELCETIKKYIPELVFLESEIGKDLDQRNYVVNNEKIERTGFHSEITLEEGIKEIIKGNQILRRNMFTNL
ncbi:MAG: NAD(P)-dependent oxidoreductase [Nanoarchaeota archaeon]|nr:NAD(P)-dependent oxidoreductase [Nanoarchaeota archaeon]